jgi:hypothetical protein
MLTVGSEMAPSRSRFISFCFSMSGTWSTVMLLAWHVKQQTDAVTLGKLRTPNLRIQSGYEQQNRSWNFKKTGRFLENRAVFTLTDFVDRVGSIFWILFWLKTLK